MKRLRFLFILLFMGISAFLFVCTYSSSQLEINNKEVYLCRIKKPIRRTKYCFSTDVEIWEKARKRD